MISNYSSESSLLLLSSEYIVDVNLMYSFFLFLWWHWCNRQKTVMNESIKATGAAVGMTIYNSFSLSSLWGCVGGLVLLGDVTLDVVAKGEGAVGVVCDVDMKGGDGTDEVDNAAVGGIFIFATDDIKPLSSPQCDA